MRDNQKRAMELDNNSYIVPVVEVIDIETESILCASGDNAGNGGMGGGFGGGE